MNLVVSGKDSDRFETQVLYCEATDSFYVINCQAKPVAGAWVAVKWPNDMAVIVEPFDGQDCFGVVQELEYQLPRKETAIQSCNLHPD